jgi:hypothetical protein
MRNFACFSCIAPSVLVKLLSPGQSIYERTLHSCGPRQEHQKLEHTLWMFRPSRCGIRLATVKMLTPYKSVCQETFTEVLQSMEAAKYWIHVM